VLLLIASILPTPAFALTSHLSRENEYGSKEGFQQKKEFKLEEKVQWPQVQQEGQPGSTNGNAPHAFRQAQSKEPQAGHCHWAFQGAAEGRKSAQEVIQSKESGLIH
jgi:hypothetical protein